MRPAVRILLVLTLLLVCAAPALADVPAKMSVQGRLTNGAGTPVPVGLRNFTFKIFDQQVGGVEIWPAGPGETQTLATDANGLWNGSVGELIPLTAAVFQEPVRWLEVTVFDGVTTETLPRIELKTVPYTYEAERLDGLNSTDFAAASHTHDGLWSANGSDYFYSGGNVGVGTGTPADKLEVSGGSLINWSDLSSNRALIDARNLNGGTQAGLGYGYWGVFGEASGTTAAFRIATAGIADGSPAGGPAWGVYGQILGNNGSGTSYAVYGVNNCGGGGPAYSGYFDAGDFVVSNTRTAGTNGVVLPSSSISDVEIEDEAGIANSVVSFPSWSGSGTVYVVDSVEITIPTSGYVEVEAQLGWINLAHTNGTATEIWCSVSKTRGSNTLEDGMQVIRLPATLASTGDWAIPMQASRVFSEGAGLHKYYLNMNYYSGADAGLSTGRPYIRARFYSTLYGTVSFSESSIAQGTGDESAKIEASRPGATILRDITVEDHQAALEAELADLRARLQALEAEAQPVVSAGQNGGQ